ncbi:MAG: hypothetical protein HY644_00770 [Acidobacteria bacterium]|nr:hypothetical protein [Acidobacteriota bacterium]
MRSIRTSTEIRNPYWSCPLAYARGSEFFHTFSVLRGPRFVIFSWIIVLLLAGTTYAKDENYRFTLDFGYRWKSEVRGSEDLYRSQWNYGEGPKLFASDLVIAAPQGSNLYADRFELKMNSWGGEPYSTGQLRVVKAGIYELRFDYQNVQYFNAIPLFANPLFGQGNLQTQHKYDSSQRVSRLQLTLLPGERISPFFAYESAGRQGDVRTSLIADGDEFLLHSHLDTHSDDFRFGANFRLDKFSLLLEQGIRWYRDDTPFSASGFQGGNSSRKIFDRDIVLTHYFGKNNVDATVPFSTGVAAYHPFDSLLLRAKVTYSNADLDSSFSDQLAGVFFSLPLAAFYPSGGQQTTGAVKKPSLFGDFSIEWQPLENFRLLERVNVRRFHVAGTALTNSTFAPMEPLLQQGIIDRLQTARSFDTFLSLDFDSQELQGLVYLTPKLVVRLGHRFERKEIEIGERRSWDRNILIAGAAYDLSTRNRIAVDYEFGRTSEPILRIDPVDFQRLRLRGRLSPLQSLEVNGSVTLFHNDDDTAAIDFTSRNRDYSVQFNYTPARRVSLSAEYERSFIHSNILFIVPQTFLSDRSIFRERGDFANLFLSFLLARGTTLSLGYSVLGTVGNFPIGYHRPSAKLDIPLGDRFAAYAQWNFYDYNEKLNLFPQDYGAHLVIFGLRVTLEKR